MQSLIPSEPFELGSIKIANLNALFKMLARPLFEVVGGTLERSDSYVVFAEVWRRRAWFSSRLVTVVSREIRKAQPEKSTRTDTAAYNAQSGLELTWEEKREMKLEGTPIEIEPFVYHVWLSLYETLRPGNT